MFNSVARLAFVVFLSTGFSFCQSSDVDRLEKALLMKIEADNANRLSPLNEWVKVGVGPVVTLLVSGLGAWYLQRLSHRQALQQSLLESEIAARRSREELLLEKDLESRQWTNQKLMEKRMSVFDQAAPLLNDLYCFMIKVGTWKEITPPAALKAKRTLDRLMYVNEALFSDDLRQAYFTFIHACFETFTGIGEDAKLLLACDEERRLMPQWNTQWENMFSDPSERQASPKWDAESELAISNPKTHRQLLKTGYRDLMNKFAIALGAKTTSAGR